MMLLPALAEAARPPQNGRKPVKVAATVQDYPSRNFLIHTDLSKAEANDLKQRLEAMLHMISSYWGTPSKGVIEICVVKDLANWPPEYQAKMEPRGIAKIQEGAGVCIGRTATRGRMWVGKAYVYAAAEHRGDKGVPLHESVHGYCDQAFGRCGPRWYAEGMAEMGHYWVAGVRGVNTLPHVLKYLRTCEPRKLESLIVSDDQLGGKWEDYCWWWFLCFFLDNNNNYSAQFRALGRHILSGQKTTFQEVFGAQAKEMDFEFRFALQHLEQGLRIDLLTWDWKRKFVSNLTPGQRLSAIVHADYGWQPSSLTVKAGTTYEYRAKDTWSAGKDAKSVDADGAANGRGRLVGVLMKDYQLSEEFELGKSGSFTPAIDGDLYLRCRAPWAKISGNSGRMTVYLRRKPAEAKTGDGK
ncbi:MAG: hypothetical protein ABFC96_09715 [Thermoguttaceae bacterium]